MKEPYLSEFRALIAAHAASRDVHDNDEEVGYATDRGAATEAFIDREVNRVEVHQNSLVPLLAAVGSAPRILDFGCGTGGTTLALALAKRLAPEHVVGIDANPNAIDAARVRARGYEITQPAVTFQAVHAGDPLPFDKASFDLVTSVSVLEFVTHADGRLKVVDDLKHVVKPGGYIFIATPRRWLREYHSGRWLGDQRRDPGFPWSSSSRELRGWFAGWERISLGAPLATIVEKRVSWAKPVLAVPAVRSLLPHVSRWQKQLWRKPPHS